MMLLALLVHSTCLRLGAGVQLARTSQRLVTNRTSIGSRAGEYFDTGYLDFYAQLVPLLNIGQASGIRTFNGMIGKRWDNEAYDGLSIPMDKVNSGVLAKVTITVELGCGFASTIFTDDSRMRVTFADPEERNLEFDQSFWVNRGDFVKGSYWYTKDLTFEVTPKCL